MHRQYPYVLILCACLWNPRFQCDVCLSTHPALVCINISGSPTRHRTAAMQIHPTDHHHHAASQPSTLPNTATSPSTSVADADGALVGKIITEMHQTSRAVLILRDNYIFSVFPAFPHVEPLADGEQNAPGNSVQQPAAAAAMRMSTKVIDVWFVFCVCRVCCRATVASNGCGR